MSAILAIQRLFPNGKPSETPPPSPKLGPKLKLLLKTSTKVAPRKIASYQHPTQTKVLPKKPTNSTTTRHHKNPPPSKRRTLLKLTHNHPQRTPTPFFSPLHHKHSYSVGLVFDEETPFPDVPILDIGPRAVPFKLRDITTHVKLKSMNRRGEVLAVDFLHKGDRGLRGAEIWGCEKRKRDFETKVKGENEKKMRVGSEIEG